MAPCSRDRRENVEAGSVEDLREEFDGWFARKERFALVTDTRPARGLPSARWRRDLTNWMNEPAVMANVVRYNVASATIFSSTVIRGGFTALTWIWRPPQPQLAAATMREAVEWCCMLRRPLSGSLAGPGRARERLLALTKATLAVTVRFGE